MLHNLTVLIVLLALLAVGNVLAPRLRLPLPVVLALCGIAIALVPGLPNARLDPELVLVLFLPPLLYADTFDTSWVDFRRWIRPILMLATGLVAVTIFAVGVTAHWLLPELPYPVCFILGAIVSPTDTIAVQTVIERLRIPRRATAIIGGESLVNDATGLVGVQIGVAVVLSGAFEKVDVLARFVWVAGGGVAIGIVAGLLFALLNRVVRETHALFALSLVSPYLAYLAATELQSSGVVAVVVAGFVVAWNIHTIAPDARLDLYSTWRLLVSVLNGLCFVFIGLETPRLLRATLADERPHLLLAGLGVSAVVILVRFAWMFPAAYLPLLASKRLREKEGGLPPWNTVVLAAWCGVRGIVSLAAALALPLVLSDGTPFPGRDAVIMCTLCVILVTLILQASTLAPLIRLLHIDQQVDSGEELLAARKAVVAAGVKRLDAYCSERSCPISIHHWRSLLSDELATLQEEDEEERRLAGVRLDVSREVRQEVAIAQSAELLHLRNSGRINDRTFVELQLQLDRENQILNGGQARRD